MEGCSNNLRKASPNLEKTSKDLKPPTNERCLSAACSTNQIISAWHNGCNGSNGCYLFNGNGG